jgi:hypothetical protein
VTFRELVEAVKAEDIGGFEVQVRYFRDKDGGDELEWAIHWHDQEAWFAGGTAEKALSSLQHAKEQTAAYPKPTREAFDAIDADEVR